jgi:hypothetical protein
MYELERTRESKYIVCLNSTPPPLIFIGVSKGATAGEIAEASNEVMPH